MKIELYRGGRPHGTWLDVQHMLVDLEQNRIMLEPGDHITVLDERPSERPHLVLLKARSPD